MKFTFTTAALCTVLAMVPVLAQARISVGYANTACAHWNDIRSSSAVVDVVREDGMVQWVSGYLTAVDALRIGARQRPYALPSYGAIKQMVHARCSATPGHTFQQVADGLPLELRDSEPASVTGE